MAVRATIVTSGTQLRVKQGDVLDIDRVRTAPGESLVFDNVLLIEDGEKLTVGSPSVADAKVSAEVLDHHRGKKVRVFKMRRRKNSRRVRGHRSELSKIRITGIETGK